MLGFKLVETYGHRTQNYSIFRVNFINLLGEISMSLCIDPRVSCNFQLGLFVFCSFPNFLGCFFFLI